MKKSFIAGVAHELGEPKDISEIEELRSDPKRLELLKRFGLSQFCQTDRSLIDLAEESIVKSFDEAGVDRESIDVLLFSTTSLYALNQGEITEMMARLRMNNCYPMGIALSECANLHSCLALARMMISSCEARRVMVVTSDRRHAGESALIHPGVAVKSDGAASCIVSDEPLGCGSYELLDVCRHAENRNFNPDPSPEEYVQHATDGVRRVTRTLLDSIGLSPTDVDWLITNNYSMSVARTLIRALGFRDDQYYSGNIPRIAHAFAADNLTNLVYCRREKATAAETMSVLIGSGPRTWGAAALRQL